MGYSKKLDRTYIGDTAKTPEKKGIKSKVHTWQYTEKVQQKRAPQWDQTKLISLQEQKRQALREKNKQFFAKRNEGGIQSIQSIQAHRNQ